MLTLFVRDGCGYCAQVLRKLEELKLKAHIKDIADEAVGIELLWHGGKRQVPFLIDDEHEAELYEAGAIIRHLEAHYGTSKAP